MPAKIKQAKTASAHRMPSAPAFARSYRQPSAHSGEASFQVVVEQTDLWITTRICESVDLAAIALQNVNILRSQLMAWMLIDPRFGESLYPLPVPDHAPPMIHRMGLASALVNVGPMATVAGAIAAMVAESLLPYSPDVIVENGGDVVLHSTRDRLIGLLPDPQNSAVLGIRIAQGEFPASVCSSSSTIGHSLSFGVGELAVVRAADAFVADAAATAFCNMLQGPDDVQKVADLAAGLEHEGIQGVYVQCQGNIGIWGNMELVAL